MESRKLDFLNRSCAFDARPESTLLGDPLKIFFDSIGAKVDLEFAITE
jgi:hypothetical protein